MRARGCGPQVRERARAVASTKSVDAGGMKKTPRRTKPVQPVTPIQPADLARVVGGQSGGVGTTPLGGG